MELHIAGGSLLRRPVLGLEDLPGLDVLDVGQLEVAQQTPELLQRVLQRSPSEQEAVVRVNGGQDVVQQRVLVLQSEHRKMSIMTKQSI